MQLRWVLVKGNFLNNENYRGLGLRHLRWMFTTMEPYQPLSWVTLGADYVVWGMDPFGYHLTNLLLHAAGTAMFFAMTLALFDAAGKGVLAGAAFAALVFGIHPLRVESVAWITERRDVLNALFVFATVLSYLKACSAPPGAARRRLYVAAVGLYVCSLLAKGMSMTLPAVLVVLDVYPLRRLPPNPLQWRNAGARRALLEKVPFLVPAMLSAGAAILGPEKGGVVASLAQHSLDKRCAVIAYGTMFYVRKTVLPTGLLPWYELDIHLDPTDASYIASALGALAVTVAVIVLRRRLPAAPAAWAAYLVMLAPVSGMIQAGSQLVADRYSLLACTPLALLAGGAVRAALRRGKTVGRPTVVACVLILAILAPLTWRQTGIWRDSVTMWRHTAAHAPDSFVARLYLGKAYLAPGRDDPDAAISALREAARLKPGDSETFYHLGRAFAKRGDLDQAAGFFRLCLKGRPDSIPARGDLASIYLAAGDLDAAAATYREILEIAPHDGSTYVNLALVAYRTGRFQDALAHLERARELGADVPPERVRMVRDALEARQEPRLSGEGQ